MEECTPIYERLSSFEGIRCRLLTIGDKIGKGDKSLVLLPFFITSFLFFYGRDSIFWRISYRPPTKQDRKEEY